jgi:uncharacterized protein (DUF305 family)
MLRNLILKCALPVVCAIALTNCDDNDQGLIVQDHDKNEFMTIMHTMNAQMDGMQMTGDPDYDFASSMMVHHQGAIDMANKELEKGKDATIKNMAQKIIDKQTAEKAELQAWIDAHTVQPNAEGQTFDQEMMDEMAKMKNWKDTQVLTGNADSDFSELMVIHHQQATDNASGILHHGSDEKIMEMANRMIKDQNKEITDFTAWLKTNGPSNQ